MLLSLENNAMLANSLVFRQTSNIIIQDLAADLGAALLGTQVAMLERADDSPCQACIGLCVFAAIDDPAPSVMIDNQPPLGGQHHQVQPGIGERLETFAEFVVQEQPCQLGPP